MTISRVRQYRNSLLFSIFTLLLGVLSLLSCSPQALVVILVTLLTHVLVHLTRRRIGHTNFLHGLVLSLSIVPLVSCGSGALLTGTLFGVSLVMTFERLREESLCSPIFVTPFLPYLVVLGSSVVSSMILELRNNGFEELLTGAGGFLSLWETFRDAPPPFFQGVVSWTRFTSIAVLASCVFSSSQRRDGMIIGVALSALVGAIIILSEKFLGGAGFEGILTSPYWLSLSRMSGIFSDPNSAGVFLGLSIFILLMQAPDGRKLSVRLGVVAVIILLVGAGTLTGSRSFMLAGGSAVVCSFLLLSRKMKVCGAFILGIAAVAATVFVTMNPTSNAVPEGIRRTVLTLTPATAVEQLFSRKVFLEVALEMFRHSPLVGVGFGRFRDFVPPLSDKLGLDIGTWSDNGNNFYLEILSECGLVGATLFLLGVFSFTFRGVKKLDKERKVNALFWSRAGTITLFLLLLTGPHIAFDEIAFLAALLIGASISPQQEFLPGFVKWSLSAVGGLVISLHASQMSYGFYPFESDKQTAYRWTSVRAQGVASCEGEEAEIEISTPRRKGRVMIYRGGFEPQEAEFSSGSPVLFKVKCIEGRATYRLEMRGAWKPKFTGMGGDPRVLGVIVRSVEPSDEAI